MNKFTELISNTSNETLKKRAATLATAAEIAQNNLINDLKAKRVQLSLKLENLTDLAPDTNDSLRPGTKDWNAENWVAEVQNTKQEIYFLDIQLELAQETHEEFFAEEKKEAKKGK